MPPRAKHHSEWRARETSENVEIEIQADSDDSNDRKMRTTAQEYKVYRPDEQTRSS